MKAFLVDPVSKTIEEVEHTDEIQDIYDKCDFDCFSCVVVDATKDTLYVDDMGLFKPGLLSFRLRGYPNLLFGKAMILGTDDLGNSMEPVYSLGDYHEMIDFSNQMEIKGSV